MFNVTAIPRLRLFFGDGLLDRKLPVALVRFVPADIDYPLPLVGTRVQRAATDRVTFELVRSRSVVRGQRRLRGRGLCVESGCGQQRFCILHFGVGAAAEAGHQ